MDNKYEVYFNLLFNEIEDYLFIADEMGTVLKANQSALNYTGFTIKELRNMNFFLLHIPEECGEAFTESMDMQEGNKARHRMHLCNKYGTSVPVETYIFEGQWDDKKAYYIIDKDISDDLKAKAQLKAIFDNLPFRAWLKDESGKYIAVNKYFKEECGKKDEEIIEKRDMDIWPGEYAESYKKYDSEVIKLKKSIHFQDYDGDRWHEVYKVPVFDEKGHIIATTGIRRDITDKKKLHIEVENQKRFLKSMIDSIPDLIFYKDTNGTYLGCNRAFAYKFMGLNEDVIIGKTDKILNKDTSLAMFCRKTDIKVIETGKAIVNEEKYLMSDGGSVDFETIKTPFYDQKGKVAGLIGISRDITKRKQAEEELVKAKKAAESANITKSKFLANMSHEIRTPLNGIIGYLQLLIQTDLDDLQKDYITEAISASDVLLYLINDVLDFSKIESGKMVMEKTMFNLRKLVEDTVLIMAPKAYQKKLVIQSFIKADVPEKVMGDPARLRQILNNLLSNSVKFTERGEVLITVQLEGKSEEKSLMKFQITDTGIGIAEDVQLFKPFTQADCSTTRKYGGTGLGLAISRELVKMMGGEIGFRSTPGKGTTFFFTVELDNIKNEDNDKDKNKERHCSLNNKNVLVVDKNKNTRSILKYYLEHEGISVFCTDNGQDAVIELLKHKYSDKKIDIVIADCEIMDINGIEPASEAAALPSISDTRFIMMSSIWQKPGSSEKKEGYFYLNKPVRRDELISCINDMPEKVRKQEKSEPAETEKIKENSYKYTCKPRILVAEDNIINQKLITRALESRGLTCDIAANGNDAMNACLTKNYDLVFMDCQMPVMDGYESTAKIRASEAEKKHTIIIAMTANAMEGDRTKCIKAGMDDYISKPVDFNVLFNIIWNYTDVYRMNAKKFKINEKYINIFMTETRFSEDDAKELFTDFTNQLPEMFRCIEEALKEEDFERLKDIAHQLKGTSGNLRISDLSELAKMLEKSAVEINKQNCLSVIEKMYEVLN